MFQKLKYVYDNLVNGTDGRVKGIPKKGGIAFHEMYQLSDNPFNVHTPNYTIWREEWLQAAGRFK
jgi:hypothetical protein